MAAITITIPDAILPRVLLGFTSVNGYQVNIPDPADPTGQRMIPNPQTRAAFAKAKLIEHIRNDVAAYEAQIAADAARQTALTKADTEVSIT